MKPFKNLEEQILIMKNRGLQFNNESKTKDYLIMNNYYNTVNRYGQFFKVSGSEKFIVNTNFDEIRSLSHFDKEIRNIFYRKAMKIEGHFKSLIAHVFSEQHPEDFSYLTNTNFNPDKVFDVAKLSAKLVNQINYNNRPKSPNNSVKHYMKKYRSVPLWVLVNYMYFSDIATFYKVMKDSDRNDVARKLSESMNREYSTAKYSFSSNEIDSFVALIVDVRNAAAHDDFLFGITCRSASRHCPNLHNEYGVSKSDYKQDLYNAFIACKPFLTNNNFVILSNTIRKKIKKLDGSLSSINTNSILSIMGFPHDWHFLDALKTK